MGVDDDRKRALRKAPLSGEVVDRRGLSKRDEPDDGPSEDDVERFGGVTRTCPECGKEVYDDSELCYHCGHAMSREPGGPPLWVIVTAVAVVALILVLVAGRVF